ncbi:MAG: hypothetical protein H7X77_04280, partial [Anaerolineae bacterium]|nr:hypothetical protein [Anaerolineae bacterium]
MIETLETHLNAHDERYQRNLAHNRTLADQLHERLAQVREGGGAKYQERQREQGKLFVRDRIDRLLDPGSAFLEIAPFAAWQLYDDETPAESEPRQLCWQRLPRSAAWRCRYHSSPLSVGNRMTIQTASESHPPGCTLPRL